MTKTLISDSFKECVRLSKWVFWSFDTLKDFIVQVEHSHKLFLFVFHEEEHLKLEELQQIYRELDIGVSICRPIHDWLWVAKKDQRLRSIESLTFNSEVDEFDESVYSLGILFEIDFSILFLSHFDFRGSLNEIIIGFEDYLRNVKLISQKMIQGITKDMTSCFIYWVCEIIFMFEFCSCDNASKSQKINRLFLIELINFVE